MLIWRRIDALPPDIGKNQSNASSGIDDIDDLMICARLDVHKVYDHQL